MVTQTLKEQETGLGESESMQILDERSEFVQSFRAILLQLQFREQHEECRLSSSDRQWG